MHTDLIQPEATSHNEVSRHKCLIYEGDPSAQLPVVIPLLTDGLQNNWRCLYLGSPELVRMVEAALRAAGVNTHREVARGALLLSSDRSHLSGGKFVPQSMVEGLCALIDAALDDGYNELCATGDMAWELGSDENFSLLLDYEARLEQVFREKPLRGICQYRRDIIPSQAVRDALVTHRSAYVDGLLNHDNLFYIPPELLLDSGGGSANPKQGEWMCQQIMRALNAEERRDKALLALKQSELSQRQLAEQLAEMNRVLDRRVQERTQALESANRNLEAFSYSVSHDLRAPLRSIKAFSEILSDDFSQVLGDEGRQHLERVIFNANHMEELIDGLLTLSRVTRAHLRKSSVDLSALAQEVVRELRESEPQRSAEVIIDGDLRAFGDKVLLRAVLANLLGNAWKFTSKCPVARIEVGKADSPNGKKVFFVRDNGAGFEMQYAQKLFGAFQRLHKQDEFPGTGIGLATVQRIMAKHDGKIRAEGRPNEGATFFFSLPDDAGCSDPKIAEAS